MARVGKGTYDRRDCGWAETDHMGRCVLCNSTRGAAYMSASVNACALVSGVSLELLAKVAPGSGRNATKQMGSLVLRAQGMLTVTCRETASSTCANVFACVHAHGVRAHVCEGASFSLMSLRTIRR